MTLLEFWHPDKWTVGRVGFGDIHIGWMIFSAAKFETGEDFGRIAFRTNSVFHDGLLLESILSFQELVCHPPKGGECAETVWQASAGDEAVYVSFVSIPKTDVNP